MQEVEKNRPIITRLRT